MQITTCLMSSEVKRIEVSGSAPFKQSGVYEVQISICDSRPSTEDIVSKRFSTIWQDRFHLHVKDAKFTQTLGSETNPIPDSAFRLSSVWIIVVDQFSSLHTIFEVQLSAASETVPDRKSTRLNSSHIPLSRMPSSA